MRPDRLVVGECRGAEIRELLAALNTGHAGGCATVHANSAREVPARLIALGSAAGLTPEAVSMQAAAALDVVLHLERGDDGVRRISEVGVVRLSGSGLVEVGSALCWDRHGPHRGADWPALAERLRMTS
jgi:pilus assembly protein CpaF